MAATETSPMKELAAIWRTCKRPDSWDLVAASRARLYTAAVHEITFKAAVKISYDPQFCPLFKWCCQWLDVADGTRKHIDKDVDLNCRLHLDPIPLSRKLMSAGSFDDEPDDDPSSPP